MGLLASQDFLPYDLPLAAVGAGYCLIEDMSCSVPDVGADTIALNKRNYGIIGDDVCIILPFDVCAGHG